MKRLNLIFALSLVFLGLNACQKDETSETVDESSISQQETQTEETLAGIDILVDEALDINFSTLKSATMKNSVYLSDCPVITINKTASPQLISIDFGSACTGKDGIVRSGKINATSISFTTFPSVRNVSFENFYVDGKKIEGDIIKTISKDQENNIRTAQIQEDITIAFPENAGSAHRVANLTRQYVRNGLLNPFDNQIVTWGTVEFTRLSGVELTKTVTSQDPLIFKVACQHIVSGTVSFVTSNNRMWSLDFGNGECDNKATLTIGDKANEIRI